jgi:hypothetical protein
MANIYVDTDEYIIITHYQDAVDDYGELFDISTPQEVANDFCRPVYDEGEDKMYYPITK